MIAVLCETREGREIASLLSEKGYKCLALTSTDYGKKLVEESGVEVLSGDITENTLMEIHQKRILDAIIDVSHPYSQKISKLLKKFSEAKKIGYIRYIREETDLPNNPNIYSVVSWKEAAEYCQKLGKTIFITTGSHNLQEFLSFIDLSKKRIVVRVLPEYKIIKKCQDIGISPRDIVAMQGPFSKQVNKAIFKMYNASVILTKDSGKAGGTDTKISAALELNIPVVVLKRPYTIEGRTARTYDEILDYLKV